MCWKDPRLLYGNYRNSVLLPGRGRRGLHRRACGRSAGEESRVNLIHRREVRKIVDDVATASARLKEASEEVREMSRHLTRSQGRLESLLTTSDSVIGKINAGQGSAGLLVNDPRLYRNSDSLVTELRGLVADFKANPKKYVNLRVF